MSLVGSHPTEHAPGAAHAALWLGICAGSAAALSATRVRASHAAILGLAAGLLFSGGDISAKLVVHGGDWLVVAVPLIVFYALGSIQLQSAFQHGDAVTAAGIATLTTNAVPIAAGVVLLRETLPGGVNRVLQVVAFGLVVGGAALLTDPRARMEQVGGPPDAVRPARGCAGGAERRAGADAVDHDRDGDGDGDGDRTVQATRDSFDPDRRPSREGRRRPQDPRSTSGTP